MTKPFNRLKITFILRKEDAKTENDVIKNGIGREGEGEEGNQKKMKSCTSSLASSCTLLPYGEGMATHNVSPPVPGLQ